MLLELACLHSKGDFYNLFQSKIIQSDDIQGSDLYCLRRSVLYLEVLLNYNWL